MVSSSSFYRHHHISSIYYYFVDARVIEYLLVLITLIATWCYRQQQHWLIAQTIAIVAYLVVRVGLGLSCLLS
jgi:hypothetical protein